MALILDGTTGASKVQDDTITSAKIVDDTINPVTDIGVGIPCFSAYQSSPQSVTASSWTKIVFQVEEFDTTNDFNKTSADYTFQPSVAGYYEVAGSIFVAVTNTTIALGIFKNNLFTKYLARTLSATDGICGGGVVVYLNGTSDYIDLRCLIGNTQNLSASASQVYFQAHLIVGA